MASRAPLDALWYNSGMKTNVSILLCAAVFAALSAAAGKLLSENDFDAVVCAQGEVWKSMRKALSLSGQDPDRFWFATFNKLEKEQIFSPKTILLDQPIARMAEAAVDLISRLQTGAPPEHLYFSSDLVRPSADR